MRIFLGTTLALALPLLAACLGPTFVVQQYAGPARPPESVAVLRVNGADAVRLMTLDDEDVAVPIESDSRLHIELLPGQHRLSVRNANAPREPLEPIVFKAEPGKVYRVTVALREPAHLWEVDRATDATSREVTAPAPAPAAEP